MKINKNAIELEMARQKLTLAALCEKSTLSSFGLNKVMNVNQEVRPKTAGLLAEALGVPVEQLIKED